MKKFNHKTLFSCIIFLMAVESILNGCSTTENTFYDIDVAANITYSYSKVADNDFENMEAQQFTLLMGNGINLGNTMEAVNTSLGYDASATKYETCWGQPVTTQELFDAYKEAGFNTVRIPVAWTNTMDWANGDFTISEDYLERVKEIIDYAYNNDMFVIINDHWDNQWWGLFGHDQTTAYKVFDAIWDTVGTYYKDYDYHLIFEAGNEEWGSRFNDEVNGKSGSLSVSQQYALITTLAQRFVDKIRAQGSYNAKRFLLIPGYDTDITKTCSSSYVMPTDSTNTIQKLLISVHYYSPSTYTILSEDASWGTCQNSWGSYSEQQALAEDFANMVKFINKGYGVIIGEYGVAKKKNSDGTYSKKKGMEIWMKSILNSCDKLNFCPILWETNNFFNKTSPYGFADEEIAEVYLNRE